MYRSIRFLPALGAVLFAFAGLSACGGGIPGNAVVAVDGKPITKATFEHWIGVAAVSAARNGLGGKPVAPVPPEYKACIAYLKSIETPRKKGEKPPTEASLKKACEQQYQSLKQEVLGFLISSQWVLGEAASLGVKLTDAEVKKQFDKIKNQQFPKASEFEKFMRSSGQTVSDLLLRVKLNMLSQKIQQKVTKQKSAVTPAQVQKYYNENKSRFAVPEKRSVEIILTKSEGAAKSAKKEVESGQSFATVAKKVSTDPVSKANGGLLPEVVKGQEDKALDTAIFSAQKGVLGGPVKTPFGYYVYRVKTSTPGSQQSLKQAESSIKAQLQVQGQQKALSGFVKNFRKKWMSKTECRAGYVVADCKSYKAPKGAGTTPETP